MKHTISILMLVVFFLSSCKTAEPLIGYWEIYKVSYDNGETILDERDKWIEFVKGGILKGGDIGKSSDKTGKWTLSDDYKVLTFDVGDVRDSGDYLIEKITKNQMVLLRNNTRIYMEKGEKN
ncbi:lipocalin family protein [Leptobacterium sp. I13]|uniref:lipocalin family protein n=1 Tax=Leptobacterium meishanense TaxID=3128904 RepID=UPI0030EF079A